MELSYQSMKVAHQVREAVSLSRSFLLFKVLNRVIVVIGNFRRENTRKALALWEAKLPSAAHLDIIRQHRHIHVFKSLFCTLVRGRHLANYHKRASDWLPRYALAFIYLFIWRFVSL